LSHSSYEKLNDFGCGALSELELGAIQEHQPVWQNIPREKDITLRGLSALL
jgi:hypothetical protein